MKKIFYSAGVITFIAALAMGATGAFFSDVEKSTGNTFTAGTLDLQVDSQSHYDGLVCNSDHHWQRENSQVPSQREDLIGKDCDGTWKQKNLGPGVDKFFNFADIKPGDNGEDTISLHVSNNAWVCANITTTGNAENVATLPELAAGDTTANGPFDGELAQNTFVFGWIDNATSTSTSPGTPGDNVWQSGEQVLFKPTALSALQNGGITLPLADSKHGSAFIASSTNYVGLAWCTGTMDVSVPGTIKCDGSTLGNIIQTDSATADITLTATQSRNNPNFLCTPPATGTLTVTKVVSGGTFGTSTFPLFVDGKLVISGVATTTLAGSHIISETGTSTYSASFSAGCVGTTTNSVNASTTVSVPGGGSATCTITNTLNAQ